MLESINKFEIATIEKLLKHPLFLQIDKIAWQNLLSILIQRRFLSLSIVNFYELAIDALENKQAKQTVREILHEEYPRNTKGIPLASHRELLFQDLLNLGATSRMIKVSKRVTPPTALQNGTCDFHRIPLLNKMVVLSSIRLMAVRYITNISSIHCHPEGSFMGLKGMSLEPSVVVFLSWQCRCSSCRFL